MKKILRKLGALVCACMLAGGALPVYALDPSTVAEDGLFHVVDFGGSESDLGSFESYDEAFNAYSASIDQYDNLSIVKDGVVYQAEYAIAQLAVSDACDYNVNVTQDGDGTATYLNGCYGADAAYLNTRTTDSDDAPFEAEIMIAGAKLWASLSDVTLIPIQNLSVNLSEYVVQDGTIYHEIKNEMDDNFYASIIDQGDAPDYLSDGTGYYSYDGHYFYTEDMLWAMLDDYQNDSRSQSVNPDSPWYDYYQFIPHRTITGASEAAAESWLTNTMGAKGPITHYQDNDLDSVDDTLTRSQYYGNIPAFWQYQYEYGANALMMMALSENESSYGRSSLSYSRNNLFGHAAYDNDVESNASRYRSVANSIYSHAKYYISGSYSSPLKEQFHGSFFGNKSSGMNVMYASDPYWGEKAASYYRSLDESMQAGDFNRWNIGIRTQANETNVYASPNEDASILYRTGSAPDMAFVLLGTDETGTWWKVQSEATLDENGEADLSYAYDWANDIGWIRMSDIQLVLGNQQYTEPSYIRVTFDPDGGTFAGDETAVSYEIPAGSAASAVAPVKEHALFTGWDSATDSVNQDTTYTAQYRDVSSIAINGTPKSSYEINDRIDLTGFTLTVQYGDGTSEDVPINTSMISGFDLSTAGDQEVSVNYAGCSTSYMIHVDAESDSIRAQLKNEILSVIEDYNGADAITGEDAERVIALKKQIDENVQPYMTIQQMRDFSRILRKAYQNRIRYIVEANDYSLGVSGLDTSIPLGDSLDKNKFIEDSYRVRIFEGVNEDAEVAMEKSASFLGNTVNDTFTIHLLLNYTEIDSNGPLVFSIAKPEGVDPGDVFTVLYYTADGDVDKCYTRQTTNTITFMANEPGQFMLISRRTSNVYTGEEVEESVTHETSSFDMERAFQIAAIAGGIGLVLVILIIVLYRHSRKKKAEVHHEESKAVVEKEVENLEVTQALNILNTEMLRLDEIAKAEKEADIKDAKKRTLEKKRKEAEARHTIRKQTAPKPVVAKPAPKAQAQAPQRETVQEAEDKAETTRVYRPIVDEKKTVDSASHKKQLEMEQTKLHESLADHVKKESQVNQAPKPYEPQPTSIVDAIRRQARTAEQKKKGENQ